MQLFNSKPQAKRAHADLGNGMVQQLPYAVTSAGNVVPLAVTNSAPMPKQSIQAQGFPVVSKQQSDMTSNNLPYAVLPDENAYGKRGVARLERGGADAAVRKQWTITISNGEATDEEFLIGDNHGLLAAALGIPAPKAGVTISGTWGASTYTNINQITGANPVDLHRLHLLGKTTAGVASDAFFSSGQLKVLYADIANNTQQSNIIPLADLVLQDSYNTNIRIDNNFRMVMDGFSAVYLYIPAAEAVTVTFREVSAYNGAYPMSKVSPNY